MATRDDELVCLRETASRLQSELAGLLTRLNQFESKRTETPLEPGDIAATETDASRAVESPAPPVEEPTAPEFSPSPPLATMIGGEHPRSPGVETVGSALQEAEGPAESGAGLEVAIGKVWLNRIGAIALLLAAVFFVKLSIDQGWIGPSTRVLLGALTGLVLLGVGEYSLARGMRTFASGILGCGVGMLYVAVFGA